MISGLSLPPQRLLKRAQNWLPWVMTLGLGLSIAGLVWGAVVSPPDYQQGHTVRIMYVHVPCSWLALFVYCFIAFMSVLYLGWKSILAQYLAQAASPLGAGFTLASLITGAIWGKPMWGTWWVWDARLTSMLILLFLYLGHSVILHADRHVDRAAKIGAIYAVIGAINIPIIKWSVNWWSTLHQPASVIRWGAPTIHISMLLPLLCVALGFLGLFFGMLTMRGYSILHARKAKPTFCP